MVDNVIVQYTYFHQFSLCKTTSRLKDHNGNKYALMCTFLCFYPWSNLNKVK